MGRAEPRCLTAWFGSRAVDRVAGVAVPLGSNRHRFNDLAALQEHFHAQGWTDGLPIVPPTEEAVQACLQWALLPPEHLIGIESVRARAITAEKVAINSVMAGCLPAHFPVVVAALTAMLAEPFQLHGPTASTGGAAVLVVISGPICDELEMAGSFSALGGGGRAETCIGRAVRLNLINLFDVRPGGIDRSTLGHPGKISYCLAESSLGHDEARGGWPLMGDERLGLAGGPEAGMVSSVTAVASLGPRQLMNEWTRQPEELLETYAAEIRANMRQYSIWPGNYVVVVPPQLQAHLIAAGWTKADVRDLVHQRARIRRGEWADVGKASVVGEKPDQLYRALEEPDDLLVVAAGGPAGGFGAVIPPWLGTRSRAVTVPIGACVGC